MKKLLVIVVSLMVFLCLFTIVFQWHFGSPSVPGASLERSEADRRESLQKIADSLDDDNAAKYYLMATLERAPLPEDDALWDRFQNTVGEGWKEDDPELENYIVANEPAFNLIKKGAEQKHYLIPTKEPSEDFLYLGDFRHLARLLVVKGRLHERKREQRKGAEIYSDLLRFAAHVSDNGPLVSAYVGFAIEGVAYDGLDSFLAHLADKEVCEELFENLIDIQKSRASPSEMLEHELAYSRQLFGLCPKELLYMGISVDDPTAGDYLLDTIQRVSGYLYLRLMLPGYIGKLDEFYQTMIEVSGKPYSEIFSEPLEDKLVTDELSQIWFEISHSFIFRNATQETTRRGYIIKVALHLHYLKNKEYPKTLDELAAIVPRFIYKKTDKGYLLYSVGGDLDDDGGEKAERPWAPGADGDLVFTPPELQGK